MSQFVKRTLTPKSEDFSGWYTDVILQAKLADYAPVKGCMVIRPYGYAIWERIQREFDTMIKAGGVENAYFPLFIPESFLKKEKEHVEGFSPELAVVTIGGGEELKEKLIVRPTSETVMYAMYAKWIKSHRDLPLLINQWNNVVRWEKRTYLFLRTTEFLWQEGHTAHATEKEAVDFAHQVLNWYKTLYEDFYAMPGIVGVKSNAEKFAGAKTTWTIEFLMPDGKVLQGSTSHNLGQNFSKVFDIQFQDEKGENQFVWQTSWGLSTRSIGGLIMMHGDDQGLVLPPKLAPIQVVIVPIKMKQDVGIRKQGEYVEKIKRELETAGIRVKVDDREGQSPGWKFNEWELKGVPIRIEVGEREMAEEMVTIVRRDTGEKVKSQSFDSAQDKKSKVKSIIENILEEIQNNLLSRAKEFLKANTHDVGDYETFKEIMKTKRGFIRAYWCEDPACEAKIKEETKASTRVLPLEEGPTSPLLRQSYGASATRLRGAGKCIYCRKEAKNKWYFGQAY